VNSHDFHTSKQAAAADAAYRRMCAYVVRARTHMIGTVQVVPEKVVASMVYVPVDVAITRMLLDTRN
jgi:hypothetical protein